MCCIKHMKKTSPGIGNRSSYWYQSSWQFWFACCTMLVGIQTFSCQTLLAESLSLLCVQATLSKYVSTAVSSFFLFQYNTEQRQREMEEEKREELQQLIQKNKNEQSEFHLLHFFVLSCVFTSCVRLQTDSLSESSHTVVCVSIKMKGISISAARKFAIKTLKA